MYVCMYHELYNLIDPLSVRMFTPEKDKSMVLWRMLLYCDVFYRTDEYMRVKNPAGGLESGGTGREGSSEPGWFREPRNPDFAKLSKSLHICRIPE